MEERLVAPPPYRDQITKHWLLNLAVEFEIVLTRLFPRVKEQGLNARAVPGCTGKDYARNLLELFDSGMIVFSSTLEDDDNLADQISVSRALDRFLALPADHKRIRYLRQGDPSSLDIDRNPAMQVTFKLTTLGGAAWQRIAQPDWSRLLIERSDFEAAHFYSGNRDLLTEYIWRYSEINEARILPNTVEWEARANSEIVYWKKLPTVHHAACQLEVNPSSRTSISLPEWYTSATKWHMDPWELAGWPLERIT